MKFFRSKVLPFLLLPLFLLLAAQLAYYLVYNGVILLNHPSKRAYPVRGADVSHYQGEIDWAILSNEGIDFVFIKATEGSSFTDDRFSYNFAEAQRCGVDAGAYHYFSFDSSGKTQAEHFIKTVIPSPGMLPPVIDVELYGRYAENPPAGDTVHTELSVMLTALEAHYGLKPILYATEDTYELYLANGYGEYDIWIRNVITKPTLSDGRQWTFWQYTNRERLDGYAGEEPFIDMNVFAGTPEEFRQYPRYPAP